MMATREEEIVKIGRDIFRKVGHSSPFFLSPAWFDDQLMGLTMRHEALKVQLFRFVDSLPALGTPEAVTGHLHEYLDVARDDLPGWIRRGIGLIPRKGLRARWLSKIARWNAEHLARRFISGSTVAEAVKAVKLMRRQHLAFTIDLLGEATITEPEADEVQHQYLELIEGLASSLNGLDEDAIIDRDDLGQIPRVNVSVKLSALFSQFDPIDPEGTSKAVRNRLRPILRLARQYRAFVNFDMEQYSFKDTTLQIFREILEEPEFRDWHDVGIAIQAYLRDTLADLEALKDWAEKRGTAVTVRLVKGAYWDYETIHAAQNDWPIPVWSLKWETDANFEKCAEYLLDHFQWLRPAYGSHNFRSMATVMAMAAEKGVPKSAYEFQMLYGMADPIRGAIVGMGHRVRIYTPYGKLLPGMAYLVRRLLENTSNESFLRAGFADHVSEEILLMNPLKKQTPAKPTPKRDGFRNEPLSDFATANIRERMVVALRDVRSNLGKHYPLFLNGKSVDTPRKLTSTNPSNTAEVLGTVALAGVEEAKAAIEHAANAYPDWRDTSIEKRAAVLHRAAEIMRRRRFELSAWIILESGKPWREADADVAEAIDFCDYYGLEMVRLSQPRKRDMPGEANETIYDSRGVAVIIAPWNFPLAILCGMASAALVAGNPVILKPAEQSPIVGALLMQVFQEAGVPPGVANLLPGLGEEVGPVLVDHPETAIIAFTGSLSVGKSIFESASKTPPNQAHLKRVIAELGGKNAIIVDADADLDEAVKGVVDSAFGYAGQKCSACSRVIVLEPIYDVFLARLVEATKSLSVGPADNTTYAMGPVIDAEAAQRIRDTIEKAKAIHQLAIGVDVASLVERGHFVGPHIFANVQPNDMLAQQEIFGPVLAVLKAHSLDEALTIANGTKYALTGGIFSRSPRALEEVRRRFRVGNLYLNRKITGALVDRQPFGGFQLSGIGSKAGGPDYLLQFLVPRTITENTLRRGFAPVEDGGDAAAGV